VAEALPFRLITNDVLSLFDVPPSASASTGTLASSIDTASIIVRILFEKRAISFFFIMQPPVTVAMNKQKNLQLLSAADLV